MPPAYRYLFTALWVTWILYWWAMSRNVKETVWREPLSSRLMHIVPLAIAGSLLSLPLPAASVLRAPLSLSAAWWSPIGLALTAAGLLFTVWARVHLGQNWSGIVTIKQDHELITTGPYALVRHPIYTGLLLAFLGSALAVGGAFRGALVMALVLFALVRKLRIEERGMRQRFGEAYAVYAKNVPALIPFIF